MHWEKRGGKSTVIYCHVLVTGNKRSSVVIVLSISWRLNNFKIDEALKRYIMPHQIHIGNDLAYLFSYYILNGQIMKWFSRWHGWERNITQYQKLYIHVLIN